MSISLTADQETAQRLRDARKRAGIPQRKAALAIGVIELTYRNYESGKQEPRASHLKTLCQMFGVSADYLLGLSS